MLSTSLEIGEFPCSDRRQQEYEGVSWRLTVLVVWEPVLSVLWREAAPWLRSSAGAAEPFEEEFDLQDS